MDSLQNAQVYLAVQSEQQTDGVVRRQLDKTIEFDSIIVLSGANIVPPVLTSAAEHTTNGLLRAQLRKFRM